MPARPSSLLVLIVVLLGAVPACASVPGAAPAADGRATVVRTIDGDTLEVRVGGRTETVRLIGIDTPETKHPTVGVECYGPEASSHLADLLPEGAEVRLERDVEGRDRYDRLLAYVHRSSDDLFVNLELAADGYAEPLAFAPNLAHEADIAAAADAARAARAGLWGACPPPVPS